MTDPIPASQPLDTWLRAQPGRCTTCGSHIETQGHLPTCAPVTLPPNPMTAPFEHADQPRLPPTLPAENTEVVDRPW